MKKMSHREFSDRCTAIQEAMQIFGHMTDNDITRAFTAYQQILAKKERMIFLNSKDHGNRPLTPLDNYDRPKCPDCGSDMMIRAVPPNDEGVKAQFVCINRECDLVLDSPMSLQQIIQELEREKREKEKNAGSI
jgi:predicted RNA-binding Zn-ribbon protein involved in translation (DUF1610 family)